MWNWGKSFAEHGAAAAWTTWPPVDPSPTVLDPPAWDRGEDAEPAGKSAGALSR
ncbi:hypothetical protein AB0H58_26190 [Nocardia neocaledoniensis]|uniref:hypothetical protein n=1 Tax=Nocardia neocaledoniensis TaxID=236511 RepID=UPI0024569FC8|nr:hypothetical protein [Nocardia neocaledoniensis]